MPVSADIYGQLQIPKPRNALADFVDVTRAQTLMQAGQLNRLKIDEHQRGLQETNALARVVSGPDFDWADPTQRRAAFAAAPTKATGAYKGFAEAQREQVGADRERFNLATERYDAYKKRLGALADDPNLSKALVSQEGLDMVRQGVLPAAIYEQVVPTLPDDPQQLRTRLLQGVRSQLSPEQMLTAFAPKPEKVDNGQTVEFRDMNPNSPTYGQTTAGAAVQKVADPNAVLSSQTAMRGQNLADARARQGQEIQRQAARSDVRETADGFVMVDKGTGQVTLLKGPDGQPLGPKLKAAPPAVQSAVLGNAQNLARAERALALVEGRDIGDPTQGGQQGDKEATGWKGYLPNQVLNRIDPRGVDARAAIADLSSLVIHDRSGAAVTAAEFPRLAPFIPTEKDDAQTVQKKLRRFVQVYREEIAAVHEAYNPSTGFRAPGGTPPASQAPAGTPTVTNW